MITNKIQSSVLLVENYNELQKCSGNVLKVNVIALAC